MKPSCVLNYDKPKRVRRCSVPDCEDKLSRRYCFPYNTKISAIWVKRIGSSKLKNDSKFLKAYCVCEKHFENICKEGNGKLKRFSLPTLLLPGFVHSGNEKDCFFSFPPQSALFKTPTKIAEILNKASTSVVTLDEKEELQLQLPNVVYQSKKKLFQQPREIPSLDNPLSGSSSDLHNQEKNTLCTPSTSLQKNDHHIFNSNKVIIYSSGTPEEKNKNSKFSTKENTNENNEIKCETQQYSINDVMIKLIDVDYKCSEILKKYEQQVEINAELRNEINSLKTILNAEINKNHNRIN